MKPLINVRVLIARMFRGETIQLPANDIVTVYVLMKAIKRMYGPKFQLVEIRDHEQIPVPMPEPPTSSFRELLNNLITSEPQQLVNVCHPELGYYNDKGRKILNNFSQLL